MNTSVRSDLASDTGPDLAGLMAAVGADRDRQAFGVLFMHFAPRVKAYLLRSGSSDQLAEELAQETLLRVWRKAHQFNPSIASPSTWVFRIARNIRIDALRRDHRPEIDPEDPALAPERDASADQQIEAAQQREKIRAAVDMLPPEQKQAILMSFFEDKPHSEIAEQLGLPLGTVKSRIRLAFARVRKTLGDNSGEEG